MAIVLTAEDAALTSIGPPLERYPVPLLLDELSVRHAAAARCKLRVAGVSASTPISTRVTLRRLVKRRTAANDA